MCACVPGYSWHKSIVKIQIPHFFNQTPRLLLLVVVWLLFEGSVYFFGKSADINNWIRYARVRCWRFAKHRAASWSCCCHRNNINSLSVMTVIRNCHVSTTIWRRRLFRSELLSSCAATIWGSIQRNMICKTVLSISTPLGTPNNLLAPSNMHCCHGNLWNQQWNICLVLYNNIWRIYWFRSFIVLCTLWALCGRMIEAIHNTALFVCDGMLWNQQCARCVHGAEGIHLVLGKKLLKL